MTPSDNTLPVESLQRLSRLERLKNDPDFQDFMGHLVQMTEAAFKNVKKCPDIELPSARARFVALEDAAYWVDGQISAIQNQQKEAQNTANH